MAMCSLSPGVLLTLPPVWASPGVLGTLPLLPPHRDLFLQVWSQLLVGKYLGRGMATQGGICGT